MFRQNLIEPLCAGCYLYYMIENLTQNVYNGKFYNVDNEFILKSASN